VIGKTPGRFAAKSFEKIMALRENLRQIVGVTTELEFHASGLLISLVHFAGCRKTKPAALIRSDAITSGRI